jgi:hypothetical protein
MRGVGRGAVLSVERVCLAAVVIITLWQVLVPPFVGLADNSDFGKVAARFSLRPPGGIFEDHFVYVSGKYVYDPQIYWNSGILSSEMIPAWLAVDAHGFMGGARSLFDIRYLGVLHAVLAGLALWLGLPALAKLPRTARVITCALLAFALIDVSWVSYWNSFYMDAATLVFLLLVAGCGVRMVAAPSTLNTGLFGCAVLLLLTSKLQHALPAIVFCAYLVWLGRRVAAAWIFAGTGVVMVAVLVATNPPFYHQKAIFNLVFYEFAPKAPDPQKALLEFGMQPGDAVALGMHAFESKYPANDPGWCAQFEKRARFGPVLLYYVRHPVEVARHIATVLADNLHEVRAGNLANFRREDGVPPGTLSRRWNWWSAAQERLYTSWPYAILAIYAIALGAAIALRRRIADPADLMLAFIAFAIAEFVAAVLGDVLDTGRHLRVFHATTDLLVVASIAALATWPTWRGRPSS